MHALAPRLRVGQLVTPTNDPRVRPETYGRKFIVDKVNPKNVRCSATDGGRGINYPADLLRVTTESEVLGDQQLVRARPLELREPIPAGTFVRLLKPYSSRDLSYSTDDVLVVIKDDGRNRINVCRAGGADGPRYLRVGPDGLTVLTLEEALNALI
jgi:hypothetical protein